MNRAVVSLRQHQRPRLTTTTSTNTQRLCPFNYEDDAGQYWATYSSGGRVFVARSDFAGPPYALNLAATPGPDDCEGRLIVDHRRRTVLVYRRKSPAGVTSVSQVLSDDDGFTWSNPTDLITNGTHPTICVGLDGSVIVAAYVAGNIKATYQAPGDTAPSALFTFKDSSNVALSVVDDSFNLVQGYEPAARWFLHVNIQGETATATFWSADEAATWTRI